MKNNLKLFNYIYYALLCTGIVYFLYIILFNYTIEPIWKFFPDSNDYKVQSEFSVFSLDFLSPQPKMYFAPRPFTVPLFYKIANSNPYKMILLQKIVYSVSIIILIFSLIKILENNFLKILTTYILLYFFTWWNIVGWSGNILSESLSMSLMFLWFAIILLYYRCQSLTNLFLLISVSILLSFTRDTWPYIILSFSFINFFVFFKKDLLKKNCLIIFASLLLFIAQDYTSFVGERYKLPVFNSIAGRISKNDEYIKWFKNEGMPLSEKLIKDFRNINIDTDNYRSFVYSKYNDSTYSELFNWILKDGRNTYKKFLLTHLPYFFLEDQSVKQKERVFCTNLFGYTQTPKGFYINSSETFPYFGVFITIILVIILVILAFICKQKILLFPLILFFLFGFNALISYNADALEVQRHLFVTQIMVEFISLFSLFLIINLLIEYSKKSKVSLIFKF